jgi:hypothetical protein
MHGPETMPSYRMHHFNLAFFFLTLIVGQNKLECLPTLQPTLKLRLLDAWAFNIALVHMAFI